MMYSDDVAAQILNASTAAAAEDGDGAARLDGRIMDEAEYIATMKPAEWTTDNRSALKRFAHSARFKKAVELVAPRNGERILDYGCSDGYFLELLNGAGAKIRAYGYDPLWSDYKVNKTFTGATRGIRFTDDLSIMDNGSFEKITCLEVLEHLEESSLEKALENIKRLLAKNGIAIISVPLEVGLASLLKNCARVILGQAHENTTPATVARSFLGLPVARRGDGSYILSHVGFDFRILERKFAEMDFDIVNRTFSPFSCLGRFLNSQVFYVLRVSGR
ncbi:MAG: class I SAM-dependent methyltransferase [Candidatus Zixiibacteriota bacterium]|jgi:2-polyprenyl-3-methyl-5-hydroxy-6-metoxy-1,4-benzoquinol methylase